VPILFRVLVAAFVCIAPTVLFLGFWHGLKRMRDDELIDRIADQPSVTADDLSLGAGPHRGHELDSTERRALQRMAVEGPDDES
jgi:hypothetical protein